MNDLETTLRELHGEPSFTLDDLNKVLDSFMARAMREEKLDIVIPHLEVPMSFFVAMNPQLRGNKVLEVEIAHLHRTIDKTLAQFVRDSRKLIGKLIVEHNRNTIAHLAGKKLSSAQLMRQCTPKLALAIEVHRRRDVEHRRCELEQALGAAIAEKGKLLAERKPARKRKPKQE